MGDLNTSEEEDASITAESKARGKTKDELVADAVRHFADDGAEASTPETDDETEEKDDEDGLDPPLTGEE